jgi:hypothetical protein
VYSAVTAERTHQTTTRPRRIVKKLKKLKKKLFNFFITNLGYNLVLGGVNKGSY